MLSTFGKPTTSARGPQTRSISTATQLALAEPRPSMRDSRLERIAADSGGISGGLLFDGSGRERLPVFSRDELDSFSVFVELIRAVRGEADDPEFDQRWHRHALLWAVYRTREASMSRYRGPRCSETAAASSP